MYFSVLAGDRRVVAESLRPGAMKILYATASLTAANKEPLKKYYSGGETRDAVERQERR
jgi:hypothetical protein